MDKKTNKISIGIDLGTTYSCIGVWQNNNVKIIPSEEGDRTVPSMVAFLNENERLIGEKAKSKIGTKNVPIIYDSKRLIGRKKDDPEIINDLSNWPFTIVEDKEGKIQIEVKVKSKKKQEEEKEKEKKEQSSKIFSAFNFEKFEAKAENFLSAAKPIPTIKQRYYPEQISAMIIKTLKENAENFLGEKITSAVITVPAYFNNSQRTCTKQAAEIAGLYVKRMINEPTAAVLAYGLNKKDECEERKIIVFDLGGGTFDVTLLELNIEKYDETNFEKTFEILAVNGDTHLGGQDFDQRILNKCKEKFQKDHDKELCNSQALTRLKRICENAKIQLSSKNECEIFVSKILFNRDLQLKLTRKEFEDMCQDLFDKCIECIDKTLKDAEVEKDEISDIVLIGGSTRIPKIKEMLAAYFNKAEIHHTIDPDEAVAMGATIQSAILDRVKEKNIEKINLLDVCPLSLGTNVKGGKMDVIIKKNSKIPIKEKATYLTTRDNQTKIKNFIYEGEHELVKDNYFLGDFSINNIEPRKKGESKIEITYYVDVNSILTATAVDLTNQKNSSNLVVINDRGNFTKEELDKLKKIENDYDNYKEKLNNNELRNFKKDIIYFKEIINDENKKSEEKYEAHKNLCLCFEKFLTTIDISNIKENDTTLEKLVIYLKLCFKEFSKLLSFDESISEEDIEKMISTIKRFLPLIVESEKYNLYEVIEDLKGYDEIYRVCLIFAIKYSYLKGREEYKNNNLIKSLDYMKDASLTANSNGVRLYLMERKDDEFKKENLKVLNNIQKYITRINIRKLIDEGDKLFKEGFQNNLIFDIHKLFDASDKYQEAIQINYDEEGNTIDEELKNISQQKLSDIIEKKFSEIKEVKAFISDVGNIINEMNDIDLKKKENLINNEESLKDLDIDEFEIKYKEEHPEIFKEINEEYEKIGNKLETKSINFIKYLLEKHPPKEYNIPIDVEKEFKKDPNKLMRKLNNLYKSDHLDNDSTEDKKNYIIIREIEVLITSLFNTIKKKLKKKDKK